jgi:hypothetical protein
MDTAQMMEMMKTVLANSQERLLATINANHEKAEANRKIDKKDTDASTKRMLAEMTEKSDADRKADKEE